MTTDSSSSEQYDQTRRDFESMKLEEQATFLVEATVSTLARGIEEAGHALAEGLDDVFKQARRTSSSAEPGPETGPGPAEPETSQRQAPKE
jgi:hypothetical protein